MWDTKKKLFISNSLGNDYQTLIQKRTSGKLPNAISNLKIWRKRKPVLDLWKCSKTPLKINIIQNIARTSIKLALPIMS